jgi:hypothetical protein
VYRGGSEFYGEMEVACKGNLIKKMRGEEVNLGYSKATFLFLKATPALLETNLVCL